MPSGLSTNDHRGIPVATFLEDVEVYMKAEGKNAKTLIAECDQMYQKVHRSVYMPLVVFSFSPLVVLL